MEPQRLIPGDSTLVENIVNYLKAKGIFDEFRHECLADVDTKSSCQNLSQRVDGYASKFLANETWHPELNKNELRNKLRRHIDESGMLAIGADHVVEQVINPKIHQLFLPKIVEVVHQYMKEQNEILNKKIEISSADNTLSENIPDTTDSNKSKASVSDPIADILSFSYSKTKSASVSSTHGKIDNTVQKHTDLLKVEKKKEEKSSIILEKNVLESPCESHSNPVVTEMKPQTDKEKEKSKKDEPEVPLEASKKAVKEEIKLDKKKVEEGKAQSSELTSPVEENKSNIPPSIKPVVSNKKDVDKNKQKPKSVSTHKSSSISSDVKKPKKEPFDKSSEKPAKSKLPKSSKEAPSPIKSVSSVKSISKEEKSVEISKSKSSESSSSRTSESSQKKSSKCSSNKIDYGSSKHKGHSEKSEKYKISKSSDKNEQDLHNESVNSEKGMKNIHYSSSYDSSQGSDQEKSSSSSSKKEKYFSKHTKKESSEKHSDKSSKVFSYKKRSKDTDDSPSKKKKSEKDERFKDAIIVGEAAKISSRSNSFGSTSSVSSSSNTSKDNLVSNSDEASECSKKDKKNKQAKEKEPCHSSKTFPPPPPPPPPSSSLSCELTSSAEVSSIEDTQSSSNSENSSSEELSEQSSSDSETESNEYVLNTLNENLMNSSTDDINDFYDIFLYSSSSSEFEGYGNSPDKKKTDNVLEKINESDISVSSVHTSDLSSYDDELSDDDFLLNDESHIGVKKGLTLKEAQELLQKRKSFLQSFHENKNISVVNKSDEVPLTFNKRTAERSSSLLSSEEESFPSEPKRSLRRERKLNPRYASSEYTSIFNSRKETFITKQSSPCAKIQTPNSSPHNEMKYKKESVVEKDRSFKKNSVETRIVKIHSDNTERSHKTKRKVYASAHLEEDRELSDSSQISISDEIDSIMDKEKLFSENDESNDVTGSDQLKLQFKIKPQSISNYTINSYSVKRKLKEAESVPAKRPCSRGSVDSSSSECVPNENKPFNSEKSSLLEEKAIRDGDIKVSDLTDAIKKDLFCKQRTNNNGDILGQKDIFPKHSLGKSLTTPERKTSETENSKELSAL